jgi:HEAT repeat protein
MLGRVALSAESGFPEGAGVQRNAAIALACIHTRDTLTFLARLLDSSDSLVRREAMLGMSRFVDNLPIERPGTVADGRSAVPLGPARYRTTETARYSLSYRPLAMGPDEESEYLQFWESWWGMVKNELH